MAADADISEIAKADLASLCEMMRELADHEGERQRLGAQYDVIGKCRWRLGA